MYVAIDAGRRRHISIVPFVDGLEAFCGSPVRSTQYGELAAVIAYASCEECRRCAVLRGDCRADRLVAARALGAKLR